MKKVLMMATTAAMTEQFNKGNILLLIDMGYEVHVAGNFIEGNPIPVEKLNEFKTWLEGLGCSFYHIPSTRKPFDFKNNYTAYKSIKKLIAVNKYSFIHCHTPIGSVIGRVAAHKMRVPVIYTAHGFHFYKGAPLINWLLFYPIEKILSRITDVLITLNKEDYSRAKKFKMRTLEYVPGVGVDLESINKTSINKKEKRKSLNLTSKDFVILSVGELNKNKNHKTIIHSIAKLDNKDIKYLICGKGYLQEELELLIRDLKIEDQVTFLGFRKDVFEIMAVSHLFAFPSFREGLSLSLMEAMGAGLPIVASRIRGNCDLVEDGLGGYLLSPSDSCEFANHIETIIKNKSLRLNMSEYNKANVKKYDRNEIIKQMKDIYKKL